MTPRVDEKDGMTTAAWHANDQSISNPKGVETRQPELQMERKMK